MNWFRKLSIARKLALVIIQAVTIALLLASAAFVLDDVVTFRQAIVRDVTILADILGANSTAALNFDDAANAADTLSALKAQPHIVSAGVYSKDGKLFAKYVRSGSADDLPATAALDGSRFEADRLVLVRQITAANKRIGTICLESDLEQLHTRLRSYAGIVALVLLGSLLFTLALSSRLQRLISKPILSLADTVKRITAEKNYTVRAERQTEDEIGLLTDGFNQMLAGIEQRDASLRAEIGERKRAEEQLRDLNETLEQRVAERAAAAEEANRAKSEFLANMSHELRTPLNSVIGFSNILLKDKAGHLRPDETTFINRILSNGKHLLGLINQILDLSKIEARKTELVLSRVSLAGMIPDILAQFESQVRGREIKLLADVPQPVAEIMADDVRLKQILINLVGNALKFTEKGSVTLRVTVNPQTRQPERIDVSDTGIGIPKDKQEKVFEAFQQADTGTERKFGGTGLGLTISRALCQLMGFRMELQSEVGKGSTFSIHIPPQSEVVSSAATVLPTLPTPSESLPDVIRIREKLVLVIDDEMDARLLLSHLLEECGCRVITADSGESALRRAKETRPDLILLDLMMPGMDGWQVLKALKANSELISIPIAITSVVASENRGTLLGAVEILQKPVSREDIIHVLRVLPHAKVLIVDDNEMDRRLMARVVEAEGGESQTAGNGREALDMLNRFTPDLILLDLLMPEMDGMTFLEHIRKDPRYKNVPVSIITGKELTDEDRRRLNHQVQVILKKTSDFAVDLKHLLDHSGTVAHTVPRFKAVAATANLESDKKFAPPGQPAV